MSNLSRPSMSSIIPEGRNAEAAIEHFSISEEESRFSRLRAAVSSDRWAGVKAGRYARLRVNGALVMSDTDMEWHTNQTLMRRAHGNVLVGGLGLGFTLLPALAKPEVHAVTVIEKVPGVSDLVLPHLQRAPGGSKLSVIVADVRTWRPPPGEKWNTIYFDIWTDICTDDLAEMALLKRRFCRRLERGDPDAWMGCWREDELRYRRRQERGAPWAA